MQIIADISSNTTIKNYDALKEFDGIYIKATEGATYTSPSLDHQVKECIMRDIPFGLYHFAGHTHTAFEEYNFFKSIAKQYPQRQLPDCLDYENKEENLNFISDFIKLDDNLIFYSYQSLVNKCITYFLPRTRIWVAKPSENVPSLDGYFGVQFILNKQSNFNNTMFNYDVSVFDDTILKIVTINNIKESATMQPIKKGEKSKRVTLIQSLLNAINKAGLTPDGDFGEKTYNAVTQYQITRGLIIDGIVGTQTINALLADINKILNN